MFCALLSQRAHLADTPALPPTPTQQQVPGATNPLSDWVPDGCWGAVCALREIEEYHALPEDLVGSSKRWREWMELERPEDEPLPGAVPLLGVQGPGLGSGAGKE